MAYTRHIDDCQLAQRSRQEGRIVLTTDRRLAREQRLEQSLLLDSFDPWEQLCQVLRTFSVEPAALQPFTRCTRCNAPLVAVPKAGLENLVPPKSYEFYTQFARCTGCGKLYWPGTHVDRMLQKLKALGLGI